MRSGRLAIVKSSEQVRMAPRTGWVVTTSKASAGRSEAAMTAAAMIWNEFVTCDRRLGRDRFVT